MTDLWASGHCRQWTLRLPSAVPAAPADGASRRDHGR